MTLKEAVVLQAHIDEYALMTEQRAGKTGGNEAWARLDAILCLAEVLGIAVTVRGKPPGMRLWI